MKFSGDGKMKGATDGPVGPMRALKPFLYFTSKDEDAVR